MGDADGLSNLSDADLYQLRQGCMRLEEMLNQDTADDAEQQGMLSSASNVVNSEGGETGASMLRRRGAINADDAAEQEGGSMLRRRRIGVDVMNTTAETVTVAEADGRTQ